MTGALADNDILIKSAAYGLLQHAVGYLVQQYGSVGVLAAARFYVPKVLSRTRLSKDVTPVLQSFEAILAQVALLEPTADETRLAAEFELAAKRANLSLNVGESQLIAIAMLRGFAALITGDKRAIESIEPILQSFGGHTNLAGVVVCMEQLIKRLLLVPVADINLAICGEAHIDTALRICFKCATGPGTAAEWIAGLDSYIEGLRVQAPNILSR